MNTKKTVSLETRYEEVGVYMRGGILATAIELVHSIRVGTMLLSGTTCPTKAYHNHVYWQMQADAGNL